MKPWHNLAAIGCLVPLVPYALGASQTLLDQFALHSTPDKYVSNSMWLFGNDGVYAFSPDGEEQRSHVPSTQVCEDLDTYTGPRHRYCRFTDIVSDGKKYVWAGRYEGVSVFDIDTGAFVGTIEACKSTRELEFHALRDEVWIRCSDVDANATDPTHLDVLSASDPGGQIQTDILVKPRAQDEDLSSSGYSVVHHTLGDVGYLTDPDSPHLFKIDLGTKEISDTIDLQPAVHGLYEAAYSPYNRHIFIRALMCCTCGSEAADVESCGRPFVSGYPVNPTTGKGAGQEGVTGICGRSCSGIQGVDTVGVYEYDTLSEKVVATHTLAEGIGGEPYTSPDGKYIVLMGKNGGNTVRVIEAGLPGAPSTTLIDLKLEFERDSDRYENLSVARDLAFAEVDGKTYLVMPSGTSHKVGIVDFSNNFDIKHVTFSDLPFKNRATYGRYRGVEWAVGTPYVWTNDSDNDEHYVIDIVKGELAHTITDIKRSSIVSVNNWERVHEEGSQAEMMAEDQAIQASATEEPADLSEEMPVEDPAMQASATEESVELSEEVMAEDEAMQASNAEDPVELLEESTAGDQDMQANGKEESGEPPEETLAGGEFKQSSGKNEPAELSGEVKAEDETMQAIATEESAELWEEMMAEDEEMIDEDSASTNITSVASLVVEACALLLGLYSFFV